MRAKKETYTAESYSEARRVMDRLLIRSCEVEIIPMPEDQWLIVTKAEGHLKVICDPKLVKTEADAATEFDDEFEQIEGRLDGVRVALHAGDVNRAMEQANHLFTSTARIRERVMAMYRKSKA